MLITLLGNLFSENSDHNDIVYNHIEESDVRIVITKTPSAK